MKDLSLPEKRSERQLLLRFMQTAIPTIIACDNDDDRVDSDDDGVRVDRDN